MLSGMLPLSVVAAATAAVTRLRPLLCAALVVMIMNFAQSAESE
jgi:hypothetical protein